jgi:hypothetical protein
VEALLTNPLYLQYLSEYQKKYKNFLCDSTAQIGDIVYIHPTENNKVIVNIDNCNDNPSVGIIVKKISITEAKVQLCGECSLLFSGLQKSKNVFLGLDGKLTNAVPNTGFIQKIGISLEDQKVFLNIDYMRIKRNPF